MRKFLSLLLLPLLLCGCGKSESTVSEAIAFRAALVEAGGCSFRADVRADFGDTVQDFSLDCTADAEGTTAFTVLKPETLAGITATVTQQGGQVTYDGMAMDFGLLANGNVSPAAAPAIAVNCWLSAYIVSAATGETVYQQDFDEKALTVTTRFENNIPFFAEVCYNQQRVLELTLSDFAFAETQ